MARETILLTRQDIGRQIDVVDGIDAIEQAMGAYERGTDYLPPKAIFDLPVGEPAFAACITGMIDPVNACPRDDKKPIDCVKLAETAMDLTVRPSDSPSPRKRIGNCMILSANGFTVSSFTQPDTMSHVTRSNSRTPSVPTSGSSVRR
jgi:hypothetical protein